MSVGTWILFSNCVINRHPQDLLQLSVSTFFMLPNFSFATFSASVCWSEKKKLQNWAAVYLGGNNACFLIMHVVCFCNFMRRPDVYKKKISFSTAYRFYLLTLYSYTRSGTAMEVRFFAVHCFVKIMPSVLEPELEARPCSVLYNFCIILNPYLCLISKWYSSSKHTSFKQRINSSLFFFVGTTLVSVA